jgi:acyl-CoA reductase-like NAD-dependent aldehyde dehydrogenase
VQAAVDSAADAQPSWAALPLPDRVALLGALADELEAAREPLSVVESLDSGNPLRATERDVDLGVRYLRQWPAYALAHAGRATRPHPDGLSYTLHRPYGVVGRIVAYNHPGLFAVAGMVFPLLAGNTIVVKAADQTPLGTLALGGLLQRVLPPGVVNLVSGGADAGDALVTSPRIKRLSFVGSGRTAGVIQSRLSQGGMVKHFSAELGGKNAMIVCPDVDLDEAVEAAIAGMSFRISQGQSCQATSRVLVHDSIHDEFRDRMATGMAKMTVGAAYDAEVDMGPLVSARQLAHVTSFLDDLPSGADVVTGGGRPDGAPAGGFYLEPTLVAGAPEGARILREEVFGPIVALQRWSEEEEALALANATELGLSAAVWSNDLDRALRLAHGVEAGYVWVNDANRHYPGAPFGGVKASGVGREESVEELASYTETTAINIRVRSPRGLR